MLSTQNPMQKQLIILSLKLGHLMASVYDVEALPNKFDTLFQLLTSFDSSLTDTNKMLSFRAMVADVSDEDLR